MAKVLLRNIIFYNTEKNVIVTVFFITLNNVILFIFISINNRRFLTVCRFSLIFTGPQYKKMIVVEVFCILPGGHYVV